MHMTNVAQNTGATDTQGVFLRDCFTVVDLTQQYPMYPRGVSGNSALAANKAGTRACWWMQVSDAKLDYSTCLTEHTICHSTRRVLCSITKLPCP